MYSDSVGIEAQGDFLKSTLADLSVTEKAIYVVINRSPLPADDGFKVRVTAIVDALAKRCTVNLIINDLLSAEQTELLSQRWPSCAVASVDRPRRRLRVAGLFSLMRVAPYHLTAEDTQEFRALLRDTIRPGALVLAESIGVAALVQRYSRAAKVFVDTHNIDSEVLARYSGHLTTAPLRFFSALSSRLMRRLEDNVFRSATEVWVCSTREARALQQSGYANVYTVPNGIALTQRGCRDRSQRDRFVFFGRLDYRPNIDALRYFAQEIAPALIQQSPTVKVDIIGAGDTSEIRLLLGGARWANVIGRVENIAETIYDSTAAIVPLRFGGGTRLKVLEAMAIGLPVISTSLGAEGIECVDGRDIMIADTADEFARKMQVVNDDEALRTKVGDAAQRLVEERYQWSRILHNHLDRMLDS